MLQHVLDPGRWPSGTGTKHETRNGLHRAVYDFSIPLGGFVLLSLVLCAVPGRLKAVRTGTVQRTVPVPVPVNVTVTAVQAVP